MLLVIGAEKSGRLFEDDIFKCIILFFLKFKLRLNFNEIFPGG